MDKEALETILMSNLDKNFVKRIVDPAEYPLMENDDGSVSTHGMMDVEVDGRFLSLPTVIMRDNKLERLEPRDAVSHAMETGEAIEFPTQEEATEFSKSYKQFWDHINWRPRR